MAIASICSSTNHCPTLPPVSLSSFPTFPTLTNQSLQHGFPTSSTSSKSGTNLVSSDTSVIAAAAEAVVLANAAREAASAAAATEKIGSCVEWDWNGMVTEKGIGLEGTRKRRKMRKCLGFMEEENQSNCSVQRLSIRSRKSGYLSSTEEAELCLCLKEWARIEVALAHRRSTESAEPLQTPRKFEPFVHTRDRNVDKVLCNARESRARLSRSYRGLVASIAAGYQGKGLSLQDLIQEGTIGLLHGAENFDPERGYKLSTYVYWWIKQAIIRAVASKSRLIRLPGSKCEMVAKVAEANNVLSRRLRRVPTCDEIAEVLNVNVSTVSLVSQRSRPSISLDKDVTDRGHMTLQDVIPGPDEMIPEKMVERQLMKQELIKLLNTLTKREAQIVKLHFGLNGEIPRSCEEIGRLLKLSRERVRQINNIAISKLQQNSLVDSLNFYLV